MMNENLVQTILKSIQDNWKFTAMADYGEGGLTYGDVAEQMAWFHLIFRRSHVRAGDKIALLGKNSVNWAITYLATVTYGAVIVPILPDFHASDAHHIINHSDASLLFVSDAIFEKIDVEMIPDCLGCISLDTRALLSSNKKTLEKAFEKTEKDFLEYRDAHVSPDSFSLNPVDANATAAMNYTSGTSGFSKGVELSHESLMSNILYGQENMSLSQGDHILSFLPLAHAYGCAFEFLMPFTLGCHITFLKKTPSPRVLLEAFQKIRPKLILSVPLIIEKIYRKQIKPLLSRKGIRLARRVKPIDTLLKRKLRTRLMDVFGGQFQELVIGGAALNPEVEAFFRSISFPITVGYGMTECGPLIGYSSWKTIKPGSVGRPVDRMEVRIDSDHPARDVGEILVRGTNLMKGYYKNPRATADAIDNEGWLHTGDLGLKDEDGFIYIKGRSKDMILGASGQNIYPEEVESKLNNREYVMESLVLDHSGKLTGLVFPDFEKVHSQGMSETDLDKHMEKMRVSLNAELPAYSRLARIEVYPEEFEKTPTRKIKRFLYTIPAAGKRSD